MDGREVYALVVTRGYQKEKRDQKVGLQLPMKLLIRKQGMMQRKRRSTKSENEK